MFHVTDAEFTMAEAAPTDKFIVVAAIDFGTTYSGYAYSMKHDPMKISINQGWVAGSGQLLSPKTPTCVLVNPQKQFDSFGYEAENKYVELLEDEEQDGWMFFRRFKMILHNSKVLLCFSTGYVINLTSCLFL